MFWVPLGVHLVPLTTTWAAHFPMLLRTRLECLVQFSVYKTGVGDIETNFIPKDRLTTIDLLEPAGLPSAFHVMQFFVYNSAKRVRGHSAIRVHPLHFEITMREDD